MKYYEDEFELGGFTFRFKNLDPIDLLAISEQFGIYLNNFDTKIYKNYTNALLSNTLLRVNGQCLPVKEGSNYYPATIKDNLKLIKDIVNKFIESAIVPSFQESNESTKEQG